MEETFTKKDKDISSLEHTSWRCQYHVVFASKYRQMEIFGEIKQDIGVIRIISITETVTLGERILRGYGRQEQESNKSLHSKSTARRSNSRPNEP